MSEQPVVEIFDSPELHVKFVPASRPGALFITFSAHNGGRPNKKGFGEAFFAKRGVPAIHFVAQRNHWWQVEAMQPGIEAAQPVIKMFARRIAYGASMGAHGALVHSAALNATHVLALSPQFAINGRTTPWMAAWAQETRALPEIFRMEEGLSRSAQIHIVFDPMDAFDVQHVRRIQAVRPVRLVHTGFAGHSTAQALAGVGQLTTLVMGMLGDQPGTNVGSAYREGRRQVLGAYMKAQGVCRKAGKVRLAERIGRRAQALADEALDQGRPQPLGDLLLATQMSGALLSGEQRLARAEKIASLYPNSADAHLIHAKALRENGRLGEALDASARARRLAKKDRRISLYRALLRAELGDIDGAHAEIEACLEARAPARAKDWLALIVLYRRAGIAAGMLDKIDAFVAKLGGETK